MAEIDWESGTITTPAGASTEPDWESGTFSQPAEKQGSSLTRRVLGDGAISAVKSAIAVPEMAVGIADIVTGGRAGKALEGIGFRPKEAKQILDDYLSPEQKAANQKVAQADGFVDTLGAVVDNPSVIPHAVVESAAPMLAGGVVGRGVTAVAPKVSSLVAGAVGEGTVMAGSAAEQIRQQTEDGLLTGKQSLAALGTGAAGAVIGAAGAKVGQKLGFGDVDTALVDGTLGASTRSMPARIAGGALVEGALQETPQSMAEQALQNVALERDLGEGVGSAAAMGLVTGGAMGAGFGAASGRRQPVEDSQPEPDPAAAPGEPPPLVVSRGVDAPDLIQPTPSAENPAPAPVERPDPANGPLSAAASLLPGAVPQVPAATPAGQQEQPAPASPEEARIREAMVAVETRARLTGWNPLLSQERARLGGELVKLQQQAAEASQPRPALGDQRSDFYTAGNGFINRERDPWVNPANNRSSDPYDRFPGIDQVPPQPLDGELLSDVQGEPAAQPAGQRGIGADARPRLMREGELMGGEVVPQGLRAGLGRGETFDGQNRAMPTQAQPRGVAPVRDPLTGELVGGDLQAQQERQRLEGRIIEGELSPREQRALSATFKRRGAAELARKGLPAPERFTVEEQGETFAIRQLPPPTPSIAGREIDGEWSEFSPESGTLAIPRAEMPQIKAEHRGAMVNFLNARGIQHEEQTVPAAELKPTQAEFSRQKVEQAKGFTGGDRAILVSSDGHVVDGHHQWLAKREAGGDVRVIRLNAPVRDLLPVVAEFPSSTTAEGSAGAAPDAAAEPASQMPVKDAAPAAPAPAEASASQAAEGQEQAAPRQSPVEVARELVIGNHKRADYVGRVFADFTSDNTTDAQRSEMLEEFGITGTPTRDAFKEAAGKHWDRNWRARTAKKKAVTAEVDRTTRELQVEATINAGLQAAAELEQLTTEAQRRMAEDAEAAGEGVALSGAEVDYLTPAEKARRHELIQALKVPDSAEQARERVQARIKARRKEAEQVQATGVVQDGDAGTLPEILSMPRRRYVDRQAKASGIKKGSPGYDQAIRRLQDQYDADVDRASAGLTFEQYNALNSESPASANRQAWEALREEYGVESSDTTLYSRAGLSPSSVIVGKAPANPISLAEAEAAAQAFLADYNGNIPLTYRIRKTQRELYGPQGDVDQLGIVKGAYHPGRGLFTLAADHLSDTADVRETLRHEILGHYGLDTFKPADKQALLEKILASKAEPSLKSAWDFVARVYADKSDLVQAEEVFTHLAEQERSSALKAVDFLRTALTRLLRNVGFKRGVITRTELLREVEVIAKGIRNGSRTYRGGNVEAGSSRERQAETRTAEGDVARYSLAGRLQADQVTEALAPIPELSGIQVVQSFDELPLSARIRAERDGVAPGDMRGVFRPDGQYLVADNLDSLEDAVHTAVHEMVGHLGVRGVLGNELDATLERIYSSEAATAKGRQRIAQIREAYAEPLKRRSPAGQRLMVAEEIVAHLAESGDRAGVLQRFVSKVRAVLRKLFPQVLWTYNDVLGLVDQSRKWLQREQAAATNPAGDDNLYSLADEARTAFERAFGPAPLDPNDPFAVENRRLREEDRTLWDKAKKVFARQFAPGGLLPRATFGEKIVRDSEFKAADIEVSHLVAGLNKAVKASMGKDMDSLTDAELLPLKEALAGKVDPAIPEPVRVALVAMRQYIDSLSTDYLGIVQGKIDELQDKAAAGETLAKAAKDARQALKDALDASTDPVVRQALDARKTAARERKIAKKQMKGLSGEARKAARQAYAAAEAAHEQAKDALWQALPPPLRKLSSLSHEANAAVASARAAKPQAEAEAALYEKIKANIGAYVHRSYQAFDDPKWFKRVSLETRNAARQYLIDSHLENGETEAEALRMADVAMSEILKTGTAYDSMEAMIGEGKLGAKDLTVLIKRKEIAPQIRALLGEYADPRLNFAKSATKMARLVWNQRFLDKVRAHGMGTFLFAKNERPADATVQIAGEQSDGYSPLNGLWTFPEVAQSFKDALGAGKLEGLYAQVVKYNGMVKYGKTILAPTTAMRNFQSALFFSLANGHFDMTRMQQAVASFREQVTQNASEGEKAYMLKMVRLGVLYDTPTAGLMADLAKDARMEELLSSQSGTVIKKLRTVNRLAQGFYSFGDDFWKVIGFENEKASLIDAGIAEAEAETMAAERIRNTYPTYSMIGQFMQKLRRFPLLGSFVSFPSEILRTSANMLSLVASDLKSDNPGLRALGRKRATGMAMVSAGFYALAAMTAAALGVDDDEEEAVRDLSPPWSKNSTFLFLGRDEDGKLQHIDMSFLDPYGYLKRPLTAMLRDQPWEDAAVSGLKDLLAPFFGADIAASAIFQVLANRKPTGGAVYNEGGAAFDQAADIANHMRKALQPGFVGNAERMILAGTDSRREGSGQPYTVPDELAGLVGWRASTLDAKTGLKYRAFDFGASLARAKKTLTRELVSSNAVSDGDIREARQAAEAQHQKTFTEMARLVKSAQAAGMSRAGVIQTLRNNGVSQANTFALINGRVPPLEIGIQTQAKAIRDARLMRDAAHAAEIARRFRVAREVQMGM